MIRIEQPKRAGVPVLGPNLLHSGRVALLTAESPPDQPPPPGSGEAAREAARRGRGTRPATAQAILDAAVQQALALGSGEFRIEQVLIDAGASSSSLYHHFGSREKLFMAVQDELYLKLALSEDTRRLDAAFASESSEEFFAYIEQQIRRIVTDPENLTVRRARVNMVAEAIQRPELAEELVRFQSIMFDVICSIFDDAKRRGLINPDLDSVAYVAWFHGMTLGRTLTELSFEDAERWIAVAVPAAIAPLRIPQ